MTGTRISNRRVPPHLFRFILVGISNTLVSYGVFIGLYHLEIVEGAALPQVFSYAGGILWSFFWNRVWTFKSRGKALGEMARFFILQMALLALSTFMVFVLVDVLVLNPTLSWIAVVVFFVTPANYFLSSNWVFSNG